MSDSNVEKVIEAKRCLTLAQEACDALIEALDTILAFKDITQEDLESTTEAIHYLQESESAQEAVEQLFLFEEDTAFEQIQTRLSRIKDFK